jgi:hypothetical protein
MNSRELFEFGNFADDTQKALGAVSSLAKSAFNKFTSGYEGARSELTRDIWASEFEKEKQEAAKAADDERKEQQKKASTMIAAGAGASGIIANLILDTEDPTEADMAAVGDFDAEALQKFSTGVDAVQAKILNMPKLMKAALKASDFLNASERTDPKINELLADLDDSKLDALARRLTQNQADSEFWRFVITSDDEAGIQKRFVNLLKKISQENEKKNLAATGAGTGKTLYTGSKLVELLRGELQVLERRIAILKELVIDMSAKPITTENLKQLRKMLKRL